MENKNLWSAFIPISLINDSYKQTHFQIYPQVKKMVAYSEFRKPHQVDPEDHRFVFFGIRYIIENFVSKKWTEQDVEILEKFLSTHNAHCSPFPFPKNLLLKFIKENDGYFPGTSLVILNVSYNRGFEGRNCRTYTHPNYSDYC